MKGLLAELYTRSLFVFHHLRRADGTFVAHKATFLAGQPPYVRLSHETADVHFCLGLDKGGRCTVGQWRRSGRNSPCGAKAPERGLGCLVRTLGPPRCVGAAAVRVVSWGGMTTRCKCGSRDSPRPFTRPLHVAYAARNHGAPVKTDCLLSRRRDLRPTATFLFR